MSEYTELFKDVFAVVPVTSYESLSLWQEWHQEKGYSWVESRGGPLITVGHINNRPICIAPLVHVIDGKRIVLYEATSMLVDWAMIEDWFKANLPPSAFDGEYIRQQNTQNFHIIMHAKLPE